MGKMSLPPGFRFHPTDIELVKYYLKKKVMGKKIPFEAIAEVDIYKFAPWDLPDKSYLKSGDLKWHFLCPKEKKYRTGGRMNRATEFGYWKTTGKDRPVLYNNEVTGMIKTLVFHRGKAPKGERTDWVMHEYSLQDKDLAAKGVIQDTYVLCIIFKKDGPGPRNGAQYGAPFKEEDWTDVEEGNCVEAIAPQSTDHQDSSVATRSQNPESISCFGSSSESCFRDTMPCAEKLLPPYSNAASDDILSMLSVFTDDQNFTLSDYDHYKNPDDCNDASNGNGIFGGLDDLSNLDGLEIPGELNGIASAEHVPFLELHDLDTPLYGNGLFDGYNYYDTSNYPTAGPSAENLSEFSLHNNFGAR